MSKIKIGSDLIDFKFWPATSSVESNLNCGLKLQKVDTRLLGRTLNLKSEI